MRSSIRWQLLLPILSLLLAAVGLSTWAGVAAAQRTASKQIERQVRNLGEVLAESNFPLNQSVLDQLKGLSGAEYLLLQRDEAATTSPALARLNLEGVPVVDNPEQIHLDTLLETPSGSYRCVGLRLPRLDEPAPRTVYIFYPETQWQAALVQAAVPSLWVGLIGMIAGSGLVLAVTERLTARMRGLQRRTRDIAAGDFRPMPLSGWKDELHDLGRSINEMAQQLAHLQDKVKQTERLRLLDQVSGGLAHQLRNGVTGARLAVQLHQQECTDQGDGEALSVALRQLTLLETRLRSFLDLGLAEQVRRTLCSITELIDDAVALLRPQCRHAHVTLTWEPPADTAMVLGDAGHLGQLFLNVLGNAIEAAGPNGRVSVQLRASDPGSPRKALVEIRDTGAGPPADIADRLFEPFVTGKPEGFGLGLAVSRQVAEAHGGSLTWERQQDETCFRITLPLAQAPAQPEEARLQYSSRNP